MKKVIIIGVVIVLAFFSFIAWSAAIKVGNVVKEAVEEEVALEQVSTQDYTFYYPKYMVQETEESSELIYFLYNENNEKTGEAINLAIQDSRSTNIEATNDICNLMALELDKSISQSELANTDTLRYTTINTDTQSGCKITNTVLTNGINMGYIAKMLWKKNSENKKIYSVAVNYYDTTDKKTVTDLNNSINYFTVR